ncbi:Crp/Fnr family transcriptional regulator [Thiomonas sp. X19]|uniref:Crp/Fnr family transcriptional regulator n=1 Tax=Thiomonas sp. X19 TaxID=1050370 RepID=UPI000DDAC95C|nr:Crp/Fnr family transcriptional regulator [Thiomonas sp. X19]
MTTAQNHIIERLPRTDRQRLLNLCEPVHLVLSDVLFVQGAPSLYAYFPVDGFISLLQRIDTHPPLEVGMVGREGMLGVQLALGVATTPLLAVVQGSGSAWRVEQSAFQHELLQSPALQQSLHRYVDVLMAQLAASASCQRFHLIGARLARWLLMSQDRVHSDVFHVTHEILAHMLGVRRVGVTVAARDLQRRGLIEYHRGELKVLDRIGLEAAACSCYNMDKEIYRTLMH